MNEDKLLRRRGDDLLESLFNVTLKLTNDIGFKKLTFQNIADAAKTSRTVLYRRWASPFDMLQELYTYKAQKLFAGEFFKELNDNGSLKADLIQLLTLYQSVYEEIGLDIINNYYYLRLLDKDGENKPAVHRQAVDMHFDAVKAILKRAADRGEPVHPINGITLMLPYDLVRLENLIRPNNMSESRIAVMVDEVLLPVFKPSK